MVFISISLLYAPATMLHQVVLRPLEKLTSTSHIRNRGVSYNKVVFLITSLNGKRFIEFNLCCIKKCLCFPSPIG